MKLSQIAERFDENHLPYRVMPLQNGIRILVSEYGGRIFGPFLDDAAESIFWVHPAFSNEDTFRAFLEAKEWNLGGDRWWVAPEIQYIIHNRADPSSGMVPASMDPGMHTLDEPTPGVLRLAQQMTLDAHVTATGRKYLSLEVITRPASDPLRYLSAYPALIEGVRYAGYEQRVTLADASPDGIQSESWNVIELYPGGRILIPISPAYQASDYERLPVTDAWQSFHDNHLEIRVTGDRLFKTGYNAAHTTGRLAYLTPLDGGQGCLMVRNFYNNPSSEYIEEPAAEPGHRGDSIHVYHDDGTYGGYGELECHGQTIGGRTRMSSSSDPFALWFYAGPMEKLKGITLHLLGIAVEL